MQSLKKKTKKMVFKTDYRLMQVISIAECSPAILSTFSRLPFVIMVSVLYIFEWPLKTGFTVTIQIKWYGMYGDISLVFSVVSLVTSKMHLSKIRT